MSTDAKLGLVLGMALLIAIAVVFFPEAPEKKEANSPPARQAQRR